MVEIVNVYSGASNFTDEQPFRRLTSAFARNLRTSEAAVLLLTESGEVVDPWTLLTRGKYFLMRKDQFQLEPVQIDAVIAKQRKGSQVEVPYVQAFSFRRNDGLFGNAVLRETESGLFNMMIAAKTLYDQCVKLLELPPEWQTLAQNRRDAIHAVLLNVKKYYKALKHKERALGERLDSLPVLRENYREQLRRVGSEDQTPTLTLMLKFLSDHDFGKVYKRKNDLAKVKRAAIHGKFTRLKERIRAQELALAQSTEAFKRNLEPFAQRAREAESSILCTFVELVSAYSTIRQELERLVALPRGSAVRIEIPADKGNVRAAEAQLREADGLMQTMVTQASTLLETHRSECERIGHTVSKLTAELHIKVHEKLPKLEKLVNSLSEHTHLLTLPEQAPGICAALDAEMARRALREREIISEFCQLEAQRAAEQQQRAEFMSRWGSLIPASALPEAFAELPNLQELRTDIQALTSSEQQPDPQALELATLMQRKRHLEEVEQLLRRQLQEQEAVTEEYRKSLGQMQGRRLEPSQIMLTEFKHLEEEQTQYFKGLKKERN